MKLNEVINSLKKDIDTISSKIESTSKDFREVRTQRKDSFLNFFDEVAANVGEVYRKLTQLDFDKYGASGYASLSLLDREQPFGQVSDQSEDQSNAA